MDLCLVRTWIHAKRGRNEQGMNLAEYVLLIAFIAVVVLITVNVLGSRGKA